MLNLNDLSSQMLELWSEDPEKFIFKIDKEGNILKYNEHFSPFIEKFPSLNELITYTHIRSFKNSLSSLNESNRFLKLKTNFSFDKEDVEDIPHTYKIIMQYNHDKDILILADPQPALTHKTAKSYFSMANDYANLSRELRKTKLAIKKQI